MPAINYVTITEKDWSGGIDQLSPEGDIPQGYVEDALNVTMGAGGEVAQRKGYEAHLSVPFRVVRYVQGAGLPYMDLYLDTDVNVAGMRPGPILIHGTTFATPGQAEFTTTPRTVWYSLYATDALAPTRLRITVPAGAGSFDYTTGLRMTVWGLTHSGSYTDAEDFRAGWVTAIDVYRAEGEETLSASLGWNLFREALRSTEGATYNMPVRYPRLRNRSVSQVYIAPLFHGAADTVLRTRGGFRFAGGEEGWGKLTSVTYSGTPDRVTAVVATPSRVSSGATPIRIEDVNTCGDLLTIKEAVYSQFNGTWGITNIDTSNSNQITFTLRIAGVNSADYDFTAQGQAGVFTDALSLDFNGAADLCRPAVGDILTCTAFSEGTRLPVVGTRNTAFTQNTFVGGVTRTELLPASTLVTFEHTGRVLGLRGATDGGTDSVNDVVPGDVLAFSSGAASAARRTVTRVQQQDATFPFGVLLAADDGVTATLTLAAVPLTGSYRAGDTVYLTRCGRLSGEWLVDEVLTSTTFTLSPTGAELTDNLLQFAGDAEVQAFVEPTMVELSLAGTFVDDAISSISISVDSRLVCVENPDTNTALPGQVLTKHLDADSYVGQPLVRTTMSADSLFLTNYTAPVLKFDGGFVSRAGLPRWQPGLFLSKQTGGGGIVPPADGTTAGATANGVFTCTTKSDASKFPAGSYCVSSTGQFLTVLDSDAGSGVVRFVETIIGAPPTTIARKATVYRYYFRASAVDANGNVLATATSQTQDTRISLVETAQVLLRLVGIPAFPQLDYNRVRIEVYRTKAGGLAPFYKLATLDQTLATANTYEPSTGRITAPYLDFADSVPDASLVEQDSLTNAFTGTLIEPFNTIEPPPRAKYVTTVAGRTAYGNVRSWPRATAQLVPTPVGVNIGESWMLRKDSADTSNVCDTVNRVGLRFIYSSTGANIDSITSIVVGTGTVTFTFGVAKPFNTTGQWMYLGRAVFGASNRTTFCGWWKVASGTTTTATINIAGITAANYTPDVTLDVNVVTFCDTPAAALFHVPVPLGFDSNFQAEQQQLGMGGLVGTQARDVSLITYRASLALNAVAASFYTSGASTSSAPWFSAFAGDTYGGQTLQLEFPTTLSTIPELETGVLPAVASAGFEIFGNGTPRSSAGSIGAVELVRPSRVLLAYPNFPEVVDAPFATDTADSFSAVDVNPSDGQEITALVPFFGESAFGAAQTSGVLIAGKPNALYAIDTATRTVTRLETQGVGVSAPGSVAVTRQGIVFAHTSGLYRLTRNLTVEPLGAKLGRLWQKLVLRNPAALANMQAHNYADARTYRFFFPTASSTGAAPRCTDAFAYNYTNEAVANKPGSWTRLDNHPVTNFCNTNEDSFFGTWDGRVMRLLGEERPESFRDDASATNVQVTFRSTDFGDPAVRKRVLHMLFEYRMPMASDGTGVELTGVAVSQAVNLVDDFEALDPAVLVPAVRRDGVSSRVPVKGLNVRYAPVVSKATQFQLRLENAQLSAPVELVSIGFRVVGLSSRGTTEAAQT